MLDEYKTPDRFWAEAINTACYSINRLYLHRVLKKTSEREMCPWAISKYFGDLVSNTSA
jgi:hypothetical protein